MISGSHRLIHGVDVSGVEIDDETRCAHYHDPNDIVAIKFKCCGKWFSCHACHGELADHAVQVWMKGDFGQPGILCGACGFQMTADEYFHCESLCPRCRRSFNPGCDRHRHLYFDI